jgi:DNA-binding CsgD family transcriptional regulator
LNVKDFTKQELYSFTTVINRWARLTDGTDLEQIFGEFSSLVPYTFSLCAVCSVRSMMVEKVINNNFPDAHVQSYVSRQSTLKSDPCVVESLTSSKSRFWMEKEGKAGIGEKTPLIGQESRLSHNITSAFSGPDGKTTFLCLSNPAEYPHRRHLQLVDILMPHLHHTVTRNFGSKYADNLKALSLKEVEVLKWVMEGKTNWEISRILPISEATVKYHLGNIFRKLEVVNKGHAVAKALQGGILMS